MGKREDIDKLVLGIEKDMGAAVNITPISELRTAFHLRRPTGLTNADIKYGGGLPGGSIIQLHGRYGTGKNLLAYLVMAENQRIYGEESCMFIASFGYKPDITQMRLCGMQVAFTDQELAEQGIDPDEATEEERGKTVGILRIIELGLTKAADEAPAEKILEGITRLMETGYFQIGLVDELGSGETKDNLVKKFDENVKMATWSSLCTRWVQRLYTVYRKPLPGGDPNAITLMVINPARANIKGESVAKGRYHVPDAQTSGFALAHAKALDIIMSSGQKIRVKGTVVGKTIRMKLGKGKNGISEGVEVQFDWYFETGVDLIDDLTQAAMAWDIIYKRKRWWYLHDLAEPMCTLKTDIGAHVRTRMEDDPSLFGRIKQAVEDVALYEDEEEEEEDEEDEEDVE